MRVLKTDPIRPDPSVLAEAARVLRSGGLVAFPTETVYGLGARAYDPAAVKRVFEAKGRPPDNPLIVHVDSIEMAEEVFLEIPEWVRAFLKRVWPGPVTVVLPKSRRVPDEVTAGLGTVAVRAPAHPVALGMIRELGEPVAAPSANLSGRPSPTTAQHVIEDLGDRVDLIIDAGETFLGVESTVIDLTTDPPTLLRPGPVAVEDLVKLLGRDVRVPPYARGLGSPDVARSPGLKHRHYAPSKPVVLVECGGLPPHECAMCVARAVEELRASGKEPVVVASEEVAPAITGRVIVLGSRRNLFEVAKNLFKALRVADALPGDDIVAEGFPEEGIGLAVMNRLRRASAERREC